MSVRVHIDYLDEASLVEGEDRHQASKKTNSFGQFEPPDDLWEQYKQARDAFRSLHNTIIEKYRV